MFDLTTVRTLLVFQNHFAYRNFLEFVHGLTEERKPVLMLFCIALFQLLRNLADIFFAHLLYICKYCFFHSGRSDECHHVVPQFLRYFKMLIFMLLFPTFGNNFIKKFNNLSVYFMGSVDCLYHRIFVYFIGACFYHNNLIPCRGNRQRKVRFFTLGARRIVNKFAVYKTNLRSRRRAVKWDIRDTCCQRRTKHCHKFWRTILVNIHNNIFKCYVIAVIFWE